MFRQFLQKCIRESTCCEMRFALQNCTKQEFSESSRFWCDICQLVSRTNNDSMKLNFKRNNINYCINYIWYSWTSWVSIYKNINYDRLLISFRYQSNLKYRAFFRTKYKLLYGLEWRKLKLIKIQLFVKEDDWRLCANMCNTKAQLNCEVIIKITTF